MANSLDPFGDTTNPVGSYRCVSCNKRLVFGEYDILSIPNEHSQLVDYGICTKCFEETPGVYVE